MYQRTIAQEIEFEGIGLHTGVYTKLKIVPSENKGILFRLNKHDIKANIDNLCEASKRGTTLSSDGQKISAGCIIIRQRGTKIHAGKNVSRGKDDTLFALIDGFVKFERKGKDKKKVSVYSA